MAIYPTRAEEIITEEKFCEFGNNWLAEPKLNGTALLVIAIGGRITTMNRHDKIYATKISDDEYLSIFPNHQDFIICGEYLNKGQEDETGQILRDKFVIWDFLSLGGDHLIGKSLIERKELLSSVVKKGKNSKRPYITKELSENIWVVKTFSDFHKAYKLRTIPLIEGVVLKRMNASLQPFFRSGNNSDWQVKVRKPTKCYKH